MENALVKKSVAAFILRGDLKGNDKLLVHSFVEWPSLPRRVPGGGIRADETPEQAVHREILEETGLNDLRMVRKLEVQHYYKPYIQAYVERHDFLLRVPAETPDGWEHQVKGNGDDAGAIFRYHWIGAANLEGVDEEHRKFITPDYLPELFGVDH